MTYSADPIYRQRLIIFHIHIKKASPADRISFAVPNFVGFSANPSPDFPENASNGGS